MTSAPVNAARTWLPPASRRRELQRQAKRPGHDHHQQGHADRERHGWNLHYDGNSHAATGSVTELAAANLGTPTFAYTPGGSSAPVTGGSYTVVGSFAGDSNYNPASSAPATITINPANPTVNATGNTCTYNGGPCAGSGTATGVNGEPLAR
jgi:hypothetical protein